MILLTHYALNALRRPVNKTIFIVNWISAFTQGYSSYCSNETANFAWDKLNYNKGLKYPRFIHSSYYSCHITTPLFFMLYMWRNKTILLVHAWVEYSVKPLINLHTLYCLKIISSWSIHIVYSDYVIKLDMYINVLRLTREICTEEDVYDVWL